MYLFTHIKVVQNTLPNTFSCICQTAYIPHEPSAYLYVQYTYCITYVFSCASAFVLIQFSRSDFKFFNCLSTPHHCASKYYRRTSSLSHRTASLACDVNRVLYSVFGSRANLWSKHQQHRSFCVFVFWLQFTRITVWKGLISKINSNKLFFRSNLNNWSRNAKQQLSHSHMFLWETFARTVKAVPLTYDSVTNA